jgi:uroporphyrin-III C-methyltransferase/precorrin-2 dehydrogenase/sirohydrochlorin ferrochelatase
MDYLPICIDLRERVCLVVGGGEVALRKVELLLRAGAAARVVAPRACAPLRALARAGRVQIAARPYGARDLRGVEVVIAATDRREVNARVAAQARARRIPINVVDEPELCTFIMPAIIERSPVVVAVSTAGASPSLARITRARVEAALPARLGQLAEFAARHRNAVKRAVGSLDARRTLWDRVLDGEIAELVLAGEERAADAALLQMLADESSRARAGAVVVLIGTGSGEPDRLPLSALRWLGRADLVLHDSRVPEAVRALARREAGRVDVGRLGTRGGWSASKLARAALRRARRGRPVCVLRAGDPYASARTAEARLIARGGATLVLIRPAPPAK